MENIFEQIYGQTLASDMNRNLPRWRNTKKSSKNLSVSVEEYAARAVWQKLPWKSLCWKYLPFTLKMILINFIVPSLVEHISDYWENTQHAAAKKGQAMTLTFTPYQFKDHDTYMSGCPTPQTNIDWKRLKTF